MKADNSCLTMTTNELKKGDTVTLYCGNRATIMDNKKGTIRLAMVFGRRHKLCPVYSHDIVCAIPKSGGFFFIEHTPAQKKLRKKVANMLYN